MKDGFYDLFDSIYGIYIRKALTSTFQQKRRRSEHVNRQNRRIYNCSTRSMQVGITLTGVSFTIKCRTKQSIIIAVRV